MKKILKTNWERYKRSEEGQKVISLFNHLTTPKCTSTDMFNAIKLFDSGFVGVLNKEEEVHYTKELDYFDKIVNETYLDEEELNGFDVKDYFLWLTRYFVSDNDNEDLFEVPQIAFKQILGYNVYLSFALYKYMPRYFIPNLYVMQFTYFVKFAEKYDIKLPKTPQRSDYRQRWLYYIEMCSAIKEFAIENEILDVGELCAFLFDYELVNIKEEIEINNEKSMPNVPEQAWILVGNYYGSEKTMKYGFWQSSPQTNKGDIMLFYEKSPVKKLNAVWTAIEDGFVDPFGYYYSYSVIGRKIEIPEDKAIKFIEFKNSEYFKNRKKEGNFVSKNFQDVSGWPVTSDDYAEIKRMLEAKGYDTSVLPSLYEPKKKLIDFGIEEEADVSKKLLIPLLEEMGWKLGVDFKSEVEFPAGRGTTGKRPDFCLHLTGTERDLGADVVIEAKYNMKNNEDIAKNYDQGLSYAKWGNAKVLVLCDKNQIRVYERNKKGVFTENKFKLFRWEEMEILERFNELKQILMC